MAEAGKIQIELSLLLDAYNKGIIEGQEKLKKLGDSAEKMGEKIKKVANDINKFGEKMTKFITLPIIAAGAAAIKYASDSEESLNKVRVSFSDNAKEVEDWSKTTLSSIGMASGSAMDAAALFGDMATSMQIPTDKAADMSMSLVTLAADLASFKNVSSDQAMQALKGIFTGEGESLKSLGVIMTDANLKAYALSHGITENYQSMSQAEKVALRYQYVMEMTSNSHGDFANTSGGAANQMRIFRESLKELSAQFGQHILPTFTSIIKKVNEFIQWFAKLDDGTKKIIITFAGIVAAVGPVLMVIGNLTKAIWILNAAMAANPIGLIIVGLILLGTYIGIAIKYWDKFGAAMLLVMGPLGLLVNMIKSFYERWEMISNAFKNNGIKEGLKEIGKALLDALIYPVMQFLQLLAKIPKVGNIFKPAIDGIQKFRVEFLGAEKLVKNSKINEKPKAGSTTIGFVSGQSGSVAGYSGSGDDGSKAWLEKQKSIRAELQKYNEEAGRNELELEELRYNRSIENLQDHLQEKYITQEEYNKTAENMTAEHEKKKTEIVEKEEERRRQLIFGGLSQISSMASELGGLFSMYYSNRQMEIDIDTQNQLDAIAEQYDAEKAHIESTITDETARNNALKALDEKRARDEKKIQEQAEKDKRKLQHDAAKKEKQIAIFTTLIGIPEAAYKAFNAMVGIPYVGPVLGAIAAAAATALGLAKLALIQSQPLPAMAAGGFFTGPAIVGELGGEGELAFPLNGTEGKNALDLLANRLLIVLENKISRSQPVAVVRETASIAKDAAKQMLHVVVNLGSKVLYDDITEATANGEILINARAIV